MARKNTRKTAAEKEDVKGDAPKYGVEDLVEATGLKAASVRVGLRDLGVEKNFANKYGWNTKKDFDEIVKAFKGRAEKRVSANKASADDKPKTTRKTRGKKAA